MVMPWHFNDRASTDNTDHVGVCFCKLLDQVNLVLRNAKVLTVKTFCLALLIQSEEEQDHIGTACKIHSLFFHGFVFLAVTLISVNDSGYGNSAGLQHVLNGIHFCGVYHGGTGTLVSWLECEITDHGCLNLLPNWKDSAFIFQKNSTFLTCPACQLMMLFMQCFFVCRFFVMLCILCCSKYQIKKLIYTLVNILLADLSALYACNQLSCCVKTWGRHFQSGTVFHTKGMIVGRAPVCDNRAVKPPLVTENILQKMLILVGINAIYLVVAAHYGFGIALFNGNFKACKVNLTKCSLIYNRIHSHTAKLLAVYCEMLCTRCCTSALYAADKCCRHFSGKIRILGKILEVTSAKRISFNVQSRSEKNVYFLFHGLFSKCNSYLLLQFFIPAVCHGCCCWKTGCRNGRVDSQMVSCASLLTHTVWSV